VHGGDDVANYIVRRILLAALTVALISFLSFVVVQLPEGDYVDWFVEDLMTKGDHISLAQAQNIREYYGLDKPMLVQYWIWVWKLAHLNFGYGFEGQKPIEEIIAERLPTTVALTGFTILITWMFAIPVGIYSAVRQHTIGDYAFTFMGFAGLAVPDFLLGLVLMYLAFKYFDFSVGGLFSGEYVYADWSWGRFFDLLEHLWIPAVVLGTAGTASLIRIMRNNLLDELAKPYVITARAKGLKSWKVVVKYPVRVALNPFISGIGQILPALVSGSVIVSVVLSLPTLGPTLLNAIFRQDMYVAGVIILMLGALTVVGTLISDLLLVVVDPRIKLGGQRQGTY
jgi:peptide/nickel transport system permease protein